MPSFTFECLSCSIRFKRTLKMGPHPSHPCPACGTAAPRLWSGQGFGFDFSPGSTPGNSGVSKHDYPTADQAVGSSAEARWEEYRNRDKVKEKVREKGSTHALIRRQGVDERGKSYVEYEAGGEAVLERRRKLVQENGETQ